MIFFWGGTWYARQWEKIRAMFLKYTKSKIHMPKLIYFLAHSTMTQKSMQPACKRPLNNELINNNCWLITHQNNCYCWWMAITLGMKCCGWESILWSSVQQLPFLLFISKPNIQRMLKLKTFLWQQTCVVKQLLRSSGS